MPLPLPNLDDRTFADLTAEMRSLIQRYDKAWTNHNTSDPGITLIELFAWLAEMLIYRMNRVETRNYLTFLELIGIRPSGPETMVSFEIAVLQADLSTSFVLPRGTRVAARDVLSGEQIVFETTADVPYSRDNWDELRKLWVFRAPAVNTVDIEDEAIGFSSGAPRQEYTLKHGPVFLVPEAETYAGNPKITERTDGAPQIWSYRADLLSSGPDAQHFTVEPLTAAVRFGDGINGKIPSRGARLLCTYRQVGGSLGNIAAGKINTLIDTLPGISASAVTVYNQYAATGGIDQETLDDMLARGLASLLEPYRAVSDDDFEYLTLRAAPAQVARVKVVADRNLALTTPDEEGHISIIILPALERIGLSPIPAAYDAVTRTFVLHRKAADLTAALAGPQVQTLKREILRYLDGRRLITTVVHIVGPSFTTVRLNVSLRGKPGVNPERLKEAVGLAIAAFLDPYAGWEDQRGWPEGRDVYRSELYQLIEAIEGVDHVTALSMNGDPTRSSITVDEYRLVALDELTVAVS